MGEPFFRPPLHLSFLSMRRPMWMAVLVFNMRMERRPPRRMWQLWKIHRGVDQTTLIVSFEDDSHFFNLRRYFFTHGRPSSYFVSDARRDQGRKERPMQRAEAPGEGGQTTAGG